ncbi:protein kinase domain containing protein [Stylonychia lemnae]|uniref:non-specific serine/threonine protein kinase n=1 Tax=Stylonychia lemnae TaxID=5949 RepID=A0A078AXF2_STYLE|nr:protein kinase domain containing protein [Stylonychia lemnae]|eukprot:CDW85463.1 protein kinase domain containing protein [Stylonychia lemnae]
MFQNLLGGITSMLKGQGKIYVVQNYTLVEEALLSEGGFAYVYRVHELNDPSKKYALKQIRILDGKLQKMVKSEVELWRKLGTHQNIVRFIESQQTKNPDGTSDMLILCELCTGGTIIDFVEKRNQVLSESEILQIMNDMVQGIKLMHTKGIAHRDLKVENVLIQDGRFKLADFGSASTDFLDFKSATKQEISKAMESYEKYTTLTYRPPEMIDQYAQYTVDLKVDIWMLGCILYTICFARHPFQDAQKLAILNAHYIMVNNDQKYKYISEKMKDFIRLMLTPDPSKRPSIHDIEFILNNYQSMEQIQLNDDAMQIKQRQSVHENTNQIKNKQPVVKSQAIDNKSKENDINFVFQKDQVNDTIAEQKAEENSNAFSWDSDWASKITKEQIQEQKIEIDLDFNPFKDVSQNDLESVKISDNTDNKGGFQLSYNPFDYVTNVIQSIAERFDKQKELTGDQDFEAQVEVNQDNNNDWKFSFDELSKGKADQQLDEFDVNQDENTKDSWTSWDTDETKNDTTKIIEFDNQEEDKAMSEPHQRMTHKPNKFDDEEAPNMFNQISELKSGKSNTNVSQLSIEKIDPNSSRKQHNQQKGIAKSWCNSFNSSQSKEQPQRNNICTWTSDIVTKFREFMSSTE